MKHIGSVMMCEHKVCFEQSAGARKPYFFHAERVWDVECGSHLAQRLRITPESFCDHSQIIVEWVFHSKCVGLWYFDVFC